MLTFLIIAIALVALLSTLGVTTSAKYGTWLERDLSLDALAAEVDREALLDAQSVTLQSHNQDINRITEIFCEPITVNQKSVKVAGSGGRLQPLDEFGDPVPRKGGGYYINGFPLYKAGVKEQFTFWASEQMTVQEFADSFDNMLADDSVWVRDQILAALFYNGAGYTFVDEKAGESVTVYGLANGDTVTYDKTTGNATDDHYSAQAAAIDDANNPLDALYTEIHEHPVNAGRVVAFISTGLEASIGLLTGFAPIDTSIINVVPAASASQEEPLFAPALNLPLPSTMRHIGTYKNMPIVSWQSIPPGPSSTNYIIPVAVDARVKPLAFRQYAVRSLQGLVNPGGFTDRFPYRHNTYVRAAGVGGLNRVGAAVARIANASYATPTGFSAPVG
jgi:hypothetical protein